MAPLSFAVLSVLFHELPSDERLAESLSSLIDTDLIIHEHVLKRPGDLVDLEEEDEPDSMRLLLSCSISCPDGRNLEELLEGLLVRVDIVKKVSLWLTSPVPVPLYGGTLKDLVVTNSILHACSIMQQNGLVFMRGAVEAERIDDLRAVAKERIAQVEALIKVHRPEIRLGLDLFAYEEMASRGIHRFDVVFQENDERSRPIFQLARNAPWVTLIQKQLLDVSMNTREASNGPSFSIIASVVYSDPGSEDQEWHSDGPHQGKDCYAICVFLPLIDLDKKVGFTQFYPRSHTRSMLGMGGAALATGSAVNAIVNRGDAVLYDYRTMHRGIGNKSEGTRRPILQLLYHRPDYKEARNYGKQSIIDKR